MALLVIDGNTVTPEPTEYEVSIEPIVKASRNGNGDLIADLINTKRKITLSWSILSRSEYATIFSYLNTPNFFVSVQYHDPDGTVKTKTFYPSPRKSGTFRFNSDTNQIRHWENVAFSLIEK